MIISTGLYARWQHVHMVDGVYALWQMADSYYQASRSFPLPQKRQVDEGGHGKRHPGAQASRFGGLSHSLCESTPQYNLSTQHK
jgi:hypothetical protein